MTTLDQSSIHSQPHPTSNTAWMPLDGVAQQWASFAATVLTRHGFTVTSTAFSALALEASAVQHCTEAERAQARGQSAFARDYCEQAVCDLHKASSQWMQVLYHLQRVVVDKRDPLDEEAYAALPQFFAQATEHLERLGVLTQQVQARGVRCYRQHGLLGYGKQEEAKG
jgi:hypothetical protein